MSKEYEELRYYGMKLMLEKIKRFGVDAFRVHADPIRPVLESVKNEPRVIPNVLWKCMALVRRGDGRSHRPFDAKELYYKRFWPVSNDDWILWMIASQYRAERK